MVLRTCGKWDGFCNEPNREKKAKYLKTGLLLIDSCCQFKYLTLDPSGPEESLFSCLHTIFKNPFDNFVILCVCHCCDIYMADDLSFKCSQHHSPLAEKYQTSNLICNGRMPGLYVPWTYMTFFRNICTVSHAIPVIAAMHGLSK